MAFDEDRHGERRLAADLKDGQAAASFFPSSEASALDMKNIDPKTWSRADFKKNLQKVATLASIVASWTPTPKDDEFVALLGSLIEDEEKFSQICNILGIP